MIDKLALDMKLSRKGDDDVRNFSVGLSMLYEKARENWPDQKFTQSVKISDGVMTVVLERYPV